jgi:hypothetical protein
MGCVRPTLRHAAMSARAAKITDAVETCLALALGQRDPFRRVAAYLATLQSSKSWTDADLIAVQTRVIRALMKRIQDDEKGRPS